MAWNVFRFCTALRGLGSIMILLVLSVVGVTYYALVITNYFPALLHGGAFHSVIALFILILFHFILFMLLWSYFSVVLTDPGSVPSGWKPAVDEERGESGPLNNSEFSLMPNDPSGQSIRVCRKCNQLKPPRCHHCSICGRCVLKMDHHCAWVVNCVGALNYKYFLLFLVYSHNVESFVKCIALCAHWIHVGAVSLITSLHLSSTKLYTFLETSLVTLALLPRFLAFFSEDEIPGSASMLATTFLAFVLNLAFSLSVFGFLIMHISLVFANTTTIEAYEKKSTPKWRYDLGRRKNFEQVFGIDKRHWFIPSYSAEDLRQMSALQGFEYPSKPDSDTL